MDLRRFHWSTRGAASASDSEILDYAAANGFVVLTHDLDFGTLLAAKRLRGPSVVQIRWHDVLPLAIGETVIRAIRAAGSLLESGALVAIDPTRQRIRVLPMD